MKDDTRVHIGSNELIVIGSKAREELAGNIWAQNGYQLVSR